MLLAIDIGNTNIVFAVFSGNNIHASWRCKTDVNRTADEYIAFLSANFAVNHIDIDNITGVIIASVVADINFELERFTNKLFKIKPIVLNNEILARYIDIKVDNPAQVGMDRVVNAIAAVKYYNAPVVVIDLGTATTFDIINGNDEFIGGVIAAGVKTTLSALYTSAPKLPRVNIDKPSTTIGKNTVDAMQAGIFWGYTGVIKTMIEKITCEMGEKPLIIATGGLSPLFKYNIHEINIIDEELTLKGLLYIYQSEKSNYS